MAGYVQLGEVRTWFDKIGSGPDLVLLHPGGVDSRAMDVNVAALADFFTVWTYDRRAHGRTPDVDGPISFEGMAADTVTFIETVVGGPVDLVGCSDGATVGLLTALRRPDLVRHLVAVAGVFHHDGWQPGILDLDEDSMAFMAGIYGEVSPDGIDHYPVVAAKLASMHAAEPALEAADLGGLALPTLVMVGDDDEVRLEHALELYRALPDGELCVVPGTSHGLLVEKPELCNRILLDFLTLDPVQTFAPIRRAG